MLLVSLIYHTPIVIRGQHVNWSSFSRWNNVRNNQSWHVPFIISEQVLIRWWCLVALMKATNLLHWEIARYSKVSTCLIIVELIVALAGASSRPMVASSGFRWSPGHDALGDALHIAPAHRHGHWNGPRRRYIPSPPPPISTAVVVAKDHVMVHIN